MAFIFPPCKLPNLHSNLNATPTPTFPVFCPPYSWVYTRVHPSERSRDYKLNLGRYVSRRARGVAYGLVLPVDPWAPTIDSQSIASQLFAFSLFPYLGFLYFITKSKSSPKLTLFGFYFLLAFVGATIPAGVYAKVHYGTSLSNVDWLHGGAESLLTLTNLFIVLGLREALRNGVDAKQDTRTPNPRIKGKEKRSI